MLPVNIALVCDINLKVSDLISSNLVFIDGALPERADLDNRSASLRSALILEYDLAITEGSISPPALNLFAKPGNCDSKSSKYCVIS